MLFSCLILPAKSQVSQTCNAALYIFIFVLNLFYQLRTRQYISFDTEPLSFNHSRSQQGVYLGTFVLDCALFPSPVRRFILAQLFNLWYGVNLTILVFVEIIDFLDCALLPSPVRRFYRRPINVDVGLQGRFP